MNHCISRGVTLNLSSISVYFINSYLDTLKGINKASEILESDKENNKKAIELTSEVLKYNADLIEKYKYNERKFISEMIERHLYRLISKNQLLLDRVL